MFIKLYSDTPNLREIQKVVDVLRNGGIIIYPTDTVYAFGCDITCARALEKMAWIKNVRPEKATFSFVFYDLSQLSEYTRNISNQAFKIIKKNLPGPFTFILPASNKVPRLLKANRKTLGIRIPNNNIAREIVKELGNPLATTSVLDDDEILEYTTDPELIYEKYCDLVDLVIDGGYGNNNASTVVDCSGDEIEILRQGIGILDE
jgi:tRNA threonylcarbamoyl adenosine modification protein (Sua5/YciO/YrdC/YwlC family)